MGGKLTVEIKLRGRGGQILSYSADTIHFKPSFDIGLLNSQVTIGVDVLFLAFSFSVFLEKYSPPAPFKLLKYCC